VNNTANEIGIFLDSEVTYCYGDGNITANVGTSIDNTGGASNNVVAKDV
jgi:hypothetical protein